MRLQHIALGTILCIAGIAASASHADTLKLVSASSTSVSIPNPNGTGSVDATVYPYYFKINDSAKLTPLMCISMNKEVSLGESWTVADSTVTTASSIGDKEEAWLLSKVGDYSNKDIQMAAWDIFDVAAASDSAFTSTAGYLVSQAYKEATMPGDLSNDFLSQFHIYTPTGYFEWGKTPQTFIGETCSPTSVTPEPCSLLLLSSGLIAMGLIVMRRRPISLISEA